MAAPSRLTLPFLTLIPHHKVGIRAPPVACATTSYDMCMDLEEGDRITVHVHFSYHDFLH